MQHKIVMWSKVRIVVAAIVAALLLSNETTALAAHKPEPPMWDLKALSKPPKVFPAPEFEMPGVHACFYEGVSWGGKPTRVFAYYGMPDVPAGTKVPAMVLVHGGGGTAFDSWVRLWTSRGYAAIAMDLCGCVPRGTYGNWERHADGGPPGWGGLDQIDRSREDQWTFHAVADIVLAHSLLRSMAGIDRRRIGITGISWGGYLTCIVSGVDRRFRFAVPVYGCGYLGEDSVWLPDFERMGKAAAQRWLDWWDPAVYLKDSRMPMLWVTGTNDFAYPLDSLQKSYRLPHGPRTLCIRVRMPHGHGGPGENPEEIHAFADRYCRAGAPLARITGQGRQEDQVWATCASRTPIIRAELNYTRDTGKWQDRHWESVPAIIDARGRRVTAILPPGARIYYLNLIDAHDLAVSTEHEER